MTSNEILKADVLDILFDNRNKQYGAYALRKNYNNRLSIALVISLSTILLVFFLMRIDHSSRSSSPVENPDLLVKTVQMPKEEKKIIIPPVKKLPMQEFRQKQFTRLVIVDKKNIDPPPDVRDLETNIISNKTVDGPVLNGTSTILNQLPVTPQKEEVKTAEIAPIQREPEFPGGQQAWINFLQKNLISPQELEAGDKKMVSIRFQVSAEGIVANFEIVQSAGRSFDNEVIRVLKKMPKWKPAIQNGLAVARAFTQPVTFVGVEQ